MKPGNRASANLENNPAAFRRLCVETFFRCMRGFGDRPAAFRRLCVETFKVVQACFVLPPAAFRRLCVETTLALTPHQDGQIQPLSGGCVLKQTTSTVLTIDFASRLQATACLNP